MDTLVNNDLVYAADVRFEKDRLVISLAGGDEISAPLAWFPKLYHAMPLQLTKWCIVAKGQMVRWQELDTEVSLSELLN